MAMIIDKCNIGAASVPLGYNFGMGKTGTSAILCVAICCQGAFADRPTPDRIVSVVGIQRRPNDGYHVSARSRLIDKGPGTRLTYELSCPSSAAYLEAGKEYEALEGRAHANGSGETVKVLVILGQERDLACDVDSVKSLD
jgi:hypothetical protein